MILRNQSYIKKKKEIGQKMRSFHTPSRVSNALDEKKRRPAATRVEGRSYLNELSSKTYATNYGGEEGKLRIKYEFTTFTGNIVRKKVDIFFWEILALKMSYAVHL